MNSGSVYALDFDGVICDSCGESSMAAVKAARVLWPDVLDGLPPLVEEQILSQMRTVRPVVETGYENILLVRLLLEMDWSGLPTPRSNVSEGLSVGEILRDWEHCVRPRALEEWGADKNALIELFGRVRDEWIRDDLPSWVAANRLYPGTADALRFAASSIYIVTTKQTRFVRVILRELGGLDFLEDRIFGLGTGPKVGILQELQSRPEHQGAALHFVEDRLATLRNVINTPALDRWNLYLGDWGYNTEDERDAAKGIPRIRILNLTTFCGKLT